MIDAESIDMKTEDIVAYKGDVELEEARWDNSFGMTVKIKLEQRPHELNAANPFKSFTRMRKDRVGTRFRAVFAASEDDISYNDEVMLKGWSDGTTGWKLTLWIHANEAGLHPFMDSQKGSTYGLVMVELDDDQEPINQVRREIVESSAKYKRKTLANYAAILCERPEFLRFLTEKEVLCTTERDQSLRAADWVRNICGISSRRELDTNNSAARLFHKNVREPYAQWYEKNHT